MVFLRVGLFGLCLNQYVRFDSAVFLIYKKKESAMKTGEKRSYTDEAGLSPTKVEILKPLQKV